MKTLFAVTAVFVSTAVRAGPFDDFTNALKKKPTARELLGTKPKATSPNTKTPSASGSAAPADLGPAPTYSGAELTAKGMEVVGIRLGMTLEEVRTALQAKGLKYAEGDTPLTYPFTVPGAKPDPYDYPKKEIRAAAKQNPGNPVGELLVLLTPEAEPKVYYVQREAQYQLGATAARPWLDAVIEKYGKPGDNDQVNRNLRMSWTMHPINFKSSEAKMCGLGQPGLSFSPKAAQEIHTRSEVCGVSGLFVTAFYSTGSASHNVEFDSAYVTSFAFRLIGFGMAEVVTRQMVAAAAVHSQGAQAQAQERVRTQAKPEL